MRANGVEAYGTIEIGGSTEVANEPGSKIVRCAVDPILFTVRVDVTLLLAGLNISGSQFSIDLPLLPPSGRIPSQRRWFGIGGVIGGLGVDVGLFGGVCGFIPISSSSRRLGVTGIGGAAIELSLALPLSGIRFV